MHSIWSEGLPNQEVRRSICCTLLHCLAFFVWQNGTSFLILFVSEMTKTSTEMPLGVVCSGNINPMLCPKKWKEFGISFFDRKENEMLHFSFFFDLFPPWTWTCVSKQLLIAYLRALPESLRRCLLVCYAHPWIGFQILHFYISLVDTFAFPVRFSFYFQWNYFIRKWAKCCRLKVS